MATLTLTQLDSDDFNRANEAALAAPWDALDASAEPPLTSNVVYRLLSGTMRFSGYNTSQTYGADQYNRWAVAAADASNRSNVRVYLRQAAHNSKNSSYYVEIYNGGAAERAFKVDGSGVETALGTLSPSLFSAGDLVGAAVVGTQLYTLRNAVATEIAVDATYATGKPVGFGVSYVSIDDWSAGTASSGASVAPFQHHYRQIGVNA